MGYEAICRCKSCKHQLMNREIMYSDGVCPHCGVCSRGTFVDYYKEVGHWETVHQGWWRNILTPKKKWVPK